MQGTETTQNGVVRVRVSDLLFALQKRWMIIVALSLVGLTFGLILSAMTVVQTSYQTYNVTGSFAVTSKNIEGQYVGGYSVPNTNDFHLAEDMVDAVRYVLRSERVLNEVINENELLGYTITQLRNAVTVTQYNSTQVLEMKIIWRNAEEGVAVWKSILRHASEILPQTLQLGSLEVINEPRAEQIGVVGGGNNRVVLMTLLGFAAGVGFAVIELLMHPTLNNVRDVETLFGVETVGVIPRDNEYYKRKDSIMTKENVGNSLVVQNFSAAAYILRNRLGTKEGHHCFYVTSAIAGEGKTTVAANLAIQLSDMEHRTLLIDFDTRNPNLGALFLNKVDYEHSLNALYRGDVTPDEAITTLSGYLDILPAVLEHNAINVDNMLIELVENLKQKYEYVILDAPPVGEVSGTLSLNQVASSVLFVIGYDKSSLPEIQSSLEKLDKSGTRVLGCIVNNVVSGRAIGMTQTADERKKNISKKAKEKKKEEERFGFEDDGKITSVGSGPFGARKNRKKKEKKGTHPGVKKEAAAQEGVEEKPAPAAVGGISKRRNIYEDTIQAPEEKLEPRSAQETINELVRLGLSNEWGSDQPDGEAPAASEPVNADVQLTPEAAPENTDTLEQTDSPAYEESIQPTEDRPTVLVLPDWDGLPKEGAPDAAETGEHRETSFSDQVGPTEAESHEDIPAEHGDEPMEQGKPAQKTEKRVIRTVSVKRRNGHIAAQAAPEQPIIITEENDAANGAENPAPDITENNTSQQEEGTEENPAAPMEAVEASGESADALPDEENPAAPSDPASEKTIPAAKKTGRISHGRLLIYLLFAIPLTLLGIGVLAALALLFAGASAAGFAYGASGVAAVLNTYTGLADRLAAAGLSLIAFALGLLMLWLVIRTLLSAIPALVRAVIACGRKWCIKEETT